MGKIEQQKIKETIQKTIETIRQSFAAFKEIADLSVKKNDNIVIIQMNLKKEYMPQKDNIAKLMDTIIKRGVAGASNLVSAGAKIFDDGVYIYYKYNSKERAEEMYEKFKKAIEE